MDPWKKGKADAKKSNLSDIVPALILGFLAHWPEISTCLRTCDSLFLKVEKVLTFIAFLFGFSKPGLLVFKVLKHLMNDVVIKLNGKTFDLDPNIEGYLQSAAAFVGQFWLADIWERAKDTTFCLRNNDCKEEIGIFLMNMKISSCDSKGTTNENWSYDHNSATVCEKVFNESPLILIVTLAGCLYMVASYEIGNGEDDPVTNPGGAQDSTNLGPQDQGNPDPAGSTDPDAQGSTSSDPEGSTNSGPDGSTNPQGSTAPSSQGPSTPDPQGSTDPIPSNRPTNEGQPVPQSFQFIDSACPTCRKMFVVPMVSPTLMYCPNCSSAPGSMGHSHESRNDPTVQKSQPPSHSGTPASLNGTGGTLSVNGNTTNDQMDTEESLGDLRARIAAKVKQRINEEVHKLAQGVCRECQDRLQQLVADSSESDGDSSNGQPPEKKSRPKLCRACKHDHNYK